MAGPQVQGVNTSNGERFILPLLVSPAFLREFVEKVMKDVDPNGFVERRPRWKQVTIAGLLDGGGLHLQDPSAPPTSSQHSSRVMAHPLTGDHFHGCAPRDGGSPGAAVS